MHSFVYGLFTGREVLQTESTGFANTDQPKTLVTNGFVNETLSLNWFVKSLQNERVTQILDKEICIKELIYFELLFWAKFQVEHCQSSRIAWYETLQQ